MNRSRIWVSVRAALLSDATKQSAKPRNRVALYQPSLHAKLKIAERSVLTFTAPHAPALLHPQGWAGFLSGRSA